MKTTEIILSAIALLRKFSDYKAHKRSKIAWYSRPEGASSLAVALATPSGQSKAVLRHLCFFS